MGGSESKPPVAKIPELIETPLENLKEKRKSERKSRQLNKLQAQLNTKTLVEVSYELIFLHKSFHEI